MRVLALILILVNLGLFAWQQWMVPVPESTPPLSQSLPGLVLLTEVIPAETLSVEPEPIVSDGTTAAADPVETESPDATADVSEDTDQAGPDGDRAGDEVTEAVSEVAVSDASVVEPVPEMICRSVGPFTGQVESRRAAALLAETGRVPMQRVTEGEVWLGHWVYLAPFRTPEEADEVAQALERSLVQDFYIIRTGELANAISLGVYSQREGAEERLSEMRERGFPAELTDRYRSAPVYWLDFAEAADEPLSLSLLMPAAPGRVLRAETGDCSLP